MPYRDPEQRNAARRARRKSDPEKHRAADRARRERALKEDPEGYRATRNASVQRWREAHPERYRTSQATYREAHREEIYAGVRDWCARNPEKVRQYNAAFRARRRGVRADFTQDEWLELLEEFDHRCAYCQASEVPLHQEHMTPITRGGAHTKGNIVPACIHCNSRKGTMTALEFAGRGTL